MGTLRQLFSAVFGGHLGSKITNRKHKSCGECGPPQSTRETSVQSECWDDLLGSSSVSPLCRSADDHSASGMLILGSETAVIR